MANSNAAWWESPNAITTFNANNAAALAALLQAQNQQPAQANQWGSSNPWQVGGINAQNSPIPTPTPIAPTQNVPVLSSNPWQSPNGVYYLPTKPQVAQPQMPDNMDESGVLQYQYNPPPAAPQWLQDTAKVADALATPTRWMRNLITPGAPGFEADAAQRTIQDIWGYKAPSWFAPPTTIEGETQRLAARDFRKGMDAATQGDLGTAALMAARQTAGSVAVDSVAQAVQNPSLASVVQAGTGLMAGFVPFAPKAIFPLLNAGMEALEHAGTLNTMPLRRDDPLKYGPNGELLGKWEQLVPGLLPGQRAGKSPQQEVEAIIRNVGDHTTKYRGNDPLSLRFEESADPVTYALNQAQHIAFSGTELQLKAAKRIAAGQEPYVALRGVYYPGDDAFSDELATWQTRVTEHLDVTERITYSDAIEGGATPENARAAALAAREEAATLINQTGAIEGQEDITTTTVAQMALGMITPRFTAFKVTGKGADAHVVPYQVRTWGFDPANFIPLGQAFGWKRIVPKLRAEGQTKKLAEVYDPATMEQTVEAAKRGLSPTTLDREATAKRILGIEDAPKAAAMPVDGLFPVTTRDAEIAHEIKQAGKLVGTTGEPNQTPVERFTALQKLGAHAYLAYVNARELLPQSKSRVQQGFARDILHTLAMDAGNEGVALDRIVRFVEDPGSLVNEFGNVPLSVKAEFARPVIREALESITRLHVMGDGNFAPAKFINDIVKPLEVAANRLNDVKPMAERSRLEQYGNTVKAWMAEFMLKTWGYAFRNVMSDALIMAIDGIYTLDSYDNLVGYLNKFGVTNDMVHGRAEDEGRPSKLSKIPLIGAWQNLIGGVNSRWEAGRRMRGFAYTFRSFVEANFNPKFSEGSRKVLGPELSGLVDSLEMAMRNGASGQEIKAIADSLVAPRTTMDNFNVMEALRKRGIPTDVLSPAAGAQIWGEIRKAGSQEEIDRIIDKYEDAIIRDQQERLALMGWDVQPRGTTDKIIEQDAAEYRATLESLISKAVKHGNMTETEAARAIDEMVNEIFEHETTIRKARESIARAISQLPDDVELQRMFTLIAYAMDMEYGIRDLARQKQAEFFRKAIERIENTKGIMRRDGIGVRQAWDEYRRLNGAEQRARLKEIAGIHTWTAEAIQKAATDWDSVVQERPQIVQQANTADRLLQEAMELIRRGGLEGFEAMLKGDRTRIDLARREAYRQAQIITRYEPQMATHLFDILLTTEKDVQEAAARTVANVRMELARKDAGMIDLVEYDRKVSEHWKKYFDFAEGRYGKYAQAQLLWAQVRNSYMANGLRALGYGDDAIAKMIQDTANEEGRKRAEEILATRRSADSERMMADNTAGDKPADKSSAEPVQKGSKKGAKKVQPPDTPSATTRESTRVSGEARKKELVDATRRAATAKEVYLKAYAAGTATEAQKQEYYDSSIALDLLKDKYKPKPGAQPAEPTTTLDAEATEPVSQPATPATPLREGIPGGTAGTPSGNPKRVTWAEGSKPGRIYNFEYTIVPRNKLIISHTDTGDVNPDYPPGLQPRARDRAQSMQQLNTIVSTYEPRARLGEYRTLDRGTPTVDKNFVVESGNVRAMAERRLQAVRPDKYAELVEETYKRAEELGFTREEVDAMGEGEPSLVRMRMDDIDPIEFAREGNRAAAAGMSDVEKAKIDASYLGDDALTQIKIPEDISVDKALVSAGNRGLVVKWFSALASEDRDTVVTKDGKELTPAGVTRLRNALLIKTYGGTPEGERLATTFIENTDSGIRNIESAMLNSLADMARAEALANSGERAPGLSITADIAKAVEIYARLKTNGQSFQDFLSQSDMFGGGKPPELSDIEMALVNFMLGNTRSPKPMREFLKGYAEALDAEPNPNQPGMFGDSARSKQEIVFDLIALHKRRADMAAAAKGTAEAEGGTLFEPRTTYNTNYQPTFYSQLEQTLLGGGGAGGKMPNTATIEQVRGILKGTVKADELKWTGFDDWLDEMPAGTKITKEQVAQFLAENRVVVKSNFSDRYATYVPGGPKQQYGELVFTLPNKMFNRADIAELHQLGLGYEALREVADLVNVPSSFKDSRWYVYRKGTDSRVLDRADKDIAIADAALYLARIGELELKPKIPYTVKKIFRADGTERWEATNGRFMATGFTQQEAITNLIGDISVTPLGNLQKPTYEKGHYGGRYANPVAHVRFDVRVAPDGTRTFFVMEDQSDWHQHGRKQGYWTAENEADLREKWDRRDVLREQIQTIYDKYETNEQGMKSPEYLAIESEYVRMREEVYALQDRKAKSVPEGPFSKTWHELVMKNMIAWAAEHGFDRVALTTGDIQSAPIDNQSLWGTDVIGWKASETKPGTYDFTITPQKGGPRVHGGENPSAFNEVPLDKAKEHLPYFVDYDEVVKRVNASPESGTYMPRYEGMKAFYDVTIPAFLRKYLKKWNATLGEGQIVAGEAEADSIKQVRRYVKDNYTNAKLKPEIPATYDFRDEMAIITLGSMDNLTLNDKAYLRRRMKDFGYMPYSRWTDPGGERWAMAHNSETWGEAPFIEPFAGEILTFINEMPIIGVHAIDAGPLIVDMHVKGSREMSSHVVNSLQHALMDIRNRYDRMMVTPLGVAFEGLERSHAQDAADRIGKVLRMWESAEWMASEPPDVHTKVHQFEITDEMRESVLNDGQSLFEPRTSEYGDIPLAEPYYSKLERVVNGKMPRSASVEQVRNILKAGGIKADELKWSGFEQWVNEQTGTISKDDALAFIRDNRVEVKEHQLKPNRNRIEVEFAHTRYDQWAQPGGRYYREFVLILPYDETTLPAGWTVEHIKEGLHPWEVRDPNGAVWFTSARSAEDAIQGALRFATGTEVDTWSYTDSHWDGVKNVLGWTRTTDRVLEDGRRILYIEEVQSGWHQDGRKAGYKTDYAQYIADLKAARERAAAAYAATGVKQFQEALDFVGTMRDVYGAQSFEFQKAEVKRGIAYDERTRRMNDPEIQAELKAARDALSELETSRSKQPPQGPFSKSWHELLVKNMLRYAAENGYDGIALTTADQVASPQGSLWGTSELTWRKTDTGPDRYYVEYNPLLGSPAGDTYKTAKGYVHDEVGLFDFMFRASGSYPSMENAIRDEAGRLWQKVQTADSGESRPRYEGMQAFYEQQLAGWLDKYVKQWQTSVQRTSLHTPRGLNKDALDAMLTATGGQGLSNYKYPATIDYGDEIKLTVPYTGHLNNRHFSRLIALLRERGIHYTYGDSDHYGTIPTLKFEASAPNTQDARWVMHQLRDEINNPVYYNVEKHMDLVVVEFTRDVPQRMDAALSEIGLRALYVEGNKYSWVGEPDRFDIEIAPYLDYFADPRRGLPDVTINDVTLDNIPVVEINDAMRQSVLYEGQPLFEQRQRGQAQPELPFDSRKGYSQRTAGEAGEVTFDFETRADISPELAGVGKKLVRDLDTLAEQTDTLQSTWVGMVRDFNERQTVLWREVLADQRHVIAKLPRNLPTVVQNYIARLIATVPELRKDGIIELVTKFIDSREGVTTKPVQGTPSEPPREGLIPPVKVPPGGWRDAGFDMQVGDLRMKPEVGYTYPLLNEPKPDTRGTALGDLKVKPGLINELASALSNDFRVKGHTSLIGKKVSRARDLGALGAVLREPRYEVVRYFFVDANDAVIDVMTVSLRLPSVTEMAPGTEDLQKWIAQQVQARNAAGFYVLHNHPSGNTSPSDADIRETARIAKAQGALFRGHVIINHGEWAELIPNIDGNGASVQKHAFEEQGGVQSRRVSSRTIGGVTVEELKSVQPRVKEEADPARLREMDVNAVSRDKGYSYLLKRGATDTEPTRERVIGAEVRSRIQLATIGQAYIAKLGDTPIVIGCDPHMRTVAVGNMDVDLRDVSSGGKFDENQGAQMRLFASIRMFGRNNGADNVSVVLPWAFDENIGLMMLARSAVENAIALDVIDVNGKSIRDFGVSPSADLSKARLGTLGKGKGRLLEPVDMFGNEVPEPGARGRKQESEIEPDVVVESEPIERRPPRTEPVPLEFDRNDFIGNANKYIKRLRDSMKVTYANKYMRWMANGEVGDAPEYPGLGYMGAQDVRLNLAKIAKESPVHVPIRKWAEFLPDDRIEYLGEGRVIPGKIVNHAGGGALTIKLFPSMQFVTVTDFSQIRHTDPALVARIEQDKAKAEEAKSKGQSDAEILGPAGRGMHRVGDALGNARDYAEPQVKRVLERFTADSEDAIRLIKKATTQGIGRYVMPDATETSDVAVLVDAWDRYARDNAEQPAAQDAQTAAIDEPIEQPLPDRQGSVRVAANGDYVAAGMDETLALEYGDRVIMDDGQTGTYEGWANNERTKMMVRLDSTGARQMQNPENVFRDTEDAQPQAQPETPRAQEQRGQYADRIDEAMKIAVRMANTPASQMGMDYHNLHKQWQKLITIEADPTGARGKWLTPEGEISTFYNSNFEAWQDAGRKQPARAQEQPQQPERWDFAPVKGGDLFSHQNLEHAVTRKALERYIIEQDGWSNESGEVSDWLVELSNNYSRWKVNLTKATWGQKTASEIAAMFSEYAVRQGYEQAKPAQEQPASHRVANPDRITDEELQQIITAVVDYTRLRVDAGGMVNKSEKDAFMMQRFGIDQSTAHSISNHIESKMLDSEEHPAPNLADYPEVEQANAADKYVQRAQRKGAAQVEPAPETAPRQAEQPTQAQQSAYTPVNMEKIRRGHLVYLQGEQGYVEVEVTNWDGRYAHYLTTSGAERGVTTPDQLYTSNDGLPTKRTKLTSADVPIGTLVIHTFPSSIPERAGRVVGKGMKGDLVVQFRDDSTAHINHTLLARQGEGVETPPITRTEINDLISHVQTGAISPEDAIARIDEGVAKLDEVINPPPKTYQYRAPEGNTVEFTRIEMTGFGTKFELVLRGADGAEVYRLPKKYPLKEAMKLRNDLMSGKQLPEYDLFGGKPDDKPTTTDLFGTAVEQPEPAGPRKPVARPKPVKGRGDSLFGDEWLGGLFAAGEQPATRPEPTDAGEAVELFGQPIGRGPRAVGDGSEPITAEAGQRGEDGAAVQVEGGDTGVVEVGKPETLPGIGEAGIVGGDGESIGGEPRGYVRDGDTTRGGLLPGFGAGESDMAVGERGGGTEQGGAGTAGLHLGEVRDSSAVAQLQGRPGPEDTGTIEDSGSGGLTLADLFLVDELPDFLNDAAQKVRAQAEPPKTADEEWKALTPEQQRQFTDWLQLSTHPIALENISNAAKYNVLARVFAEETDTLGGTLYEGSSGYYSSDGRSDWHITYDVDRGPVARIETNIDAIRTLKQIESEKRRATPSEQEILYRYTGWGGLDKLFERPGRSMDFEMTRRQHRLKQLLTKDEFSAARRSILTGYYTDTPYIDAIWAALRQMGFTGGKWLDNAAGIGKFKGRMPTDMDAQSYVTMIERDPITARIAAQLYQSADVHALAYEDSRLPLAYYDAVATNMPFGDVSVFDPAITDPLLTSKVHNYYFAKSLEHVRPGGLIAFITSRYVLDGANTKLRDYIAGRADFLGAIRLPNNAFAKADTSVTTDIIFLRKRTGGEPNPPNRGDWVDTVAQKDDFGVEYTLNKYYVDHPEMMLGRMQVMSGGTAGRASQPNLLPIHDDMAAALMEAVNKLPKDVYTSAQRAAADEALARAQLAQSRSTERLLEGQNVLIEGKLHIIKDKLPQPVEYQSEKSLALKAQVKMVNMLRETLALMADDTTPEAMIREKQDALGTAYDWFVQRFGHIRDKKIAKLLKDDPMYPRMVSLEDIDADDNIVKAAIFNKRVTGAPKSIDSTDNPQEALTASLVQHGRVDIGYISQLLRRGRNAVPKLLDGLVYRDPNGGYVLSAEYLSGNIWEKLQQAELAARSAPEFKKNVDALNAVMPAPSGPGEINVRLGAPWIPVETYADFMAHLTGATFEVEYAPYGNHWKVEWKKGNYIVGDTRWATNRVGVAELVKLAMKGKKPRVYDRAEVGGKWVNVLNKDATKLAEEAQRKIKGEFERWLWSDGQRGAHMADVYNKGYGSIVERVWDGEHMVFAGMTDDITMRSHQKAGAFRISTGQTVYLAHDVGSGKTFTMIAGGMELRRLGLRRKIVYAVPRATITQFESQFRKLYPGANLLVLSSSDTNKLNVQVTLSRIATGDYDGIIISHDALKRIPLSAESKQEQLTEQIDQARESLYELEDSDAKWQTVKQAEKALEDLENKLAQIMNDKQTEPLTWEELGIDQLFVDEAHAFKNLWYSSSMTDVRNMGERKGSDRANDMLMKAHAIQRRQRGGGVVFSSGTPVTNSLVEAYSIQRMLQNELLGKMGLRHFDAWASAFADVTDLMTTDATNKAKVVSSLSEFLNMTDLKYKMSDVLDIRTQYTLQMKLPEIEGGEPQAVVAPKSKLMKAIISDLIRRAEAIEGTSSADGGDNILTINGDAKAAALDIRTYAKGLPDDPQSKLNMAVKNVLDIYKQTADYKGAQLLFLDFSKPKKHGGKSRTGFSAYDDLIEKLVAQGIPRSEIASIYEWDNPRKPELKEKLNRLVNAGKIRVVIGSTMKLGTGVNMQERLYAVHHLDVPWRPADIEQRNGRMIRQGNTHIDMGKVVRVLNYVTEGTFDAVMWEGLKRKSKYTGQFMTEKPTPRRLKDDTVFTLNARQMQAEAAGNPTVRRMMELESMARDLESLKDGWWSDKRQKSANLYALEQSIPQKQQQAQQLADLVEQTAGFGDEPLKVSFNNEVFDRATDEKARAKLAEAMKTWALMPTDGTIGRVKAGKTVLLLRHSSELDRLLGIKDPSVGIYTQEGVMVGNFYIDPTSDGNPARMENVIRQLASKHQAALERIRQDQVMIEELRQSVAVNEFPHTDELTSLKNEMAALMKDYKIQDTDAEEVTDRVTREGWFKMDEDEDLDILEEPRVPYEDDFKNFGQFFEGMGKGLTSGMYDTLFEALRQGKDTAAGVRDPILAFAKPAYERGEIKSAEELQKYVNANYKPRGAKPVEQPQWVAPEDQPPQRVDDGGGLQLLKPAQPQGMWRETPEQAAARVKRAAEVDAMLAPRTQAAGGGAIPPIEPPAPPAGLEMPEWESPYEKRMARMKQPQPVEDGDIIANPDPALEIAAQADAPIPVENLIAQDAVAERTGERGEGFKGVRDYVAQEQLKALNAIRDSAKEHLQTGGDRASVTPEQQKVIDAEVQAAARQLREIVDAAKTYANERTNFSLLDYGSRRGIDLWLGALFPFNYWATRQGKNFMLRMLSDPRFVTTYLRYQDAMDRENKKRGTRKRFQRGFRIPLNQLTSGKLDDVYIDPLSSIIPYSDLLGSDDADSQGTALQEAYKMASAVGLRPTPLLDIPLRMSGIMVGKNPNDPGYDEANAQWGASSVGAFIPQTGMIKAATAAAGMGPAGMGFSIEAPLRKALGMQETDQWDAYRVARSIANMAAVQQQQDGEQFDRRPYLAAEEWLAKHTRDLPTAIVSMKPAEIAAELGIDVDMAAKALAIASEAANTAARERGTSVLASTMLGVRAQQHPQGEYLRNEMRREERGAAWDPYTQQGSRGEVQAVQRANPALEVQRAMYGTLPGEQYDYRWLYDRAMQDEINQKFDALKDQAITMRPWDRRTGYAIEDARRAALDRVDRDKMSNTAEWQDDYLKAASAVTGISNTGQPVPAPTALQSYKPRSVSGANPDEVLNIRQQEIMQQVSRTQPRAESYITAQGEIDYAAYRAAIDEWDKTLGRIAVGLPATQVIMANAKNEGIDKKLTQFMKQLTREQIDKYRWRYDTPLEAAQRTYYEAVYSPVMDSYVALRDQGDEQAWDKTVGAVGVIDGRLLATMVAKLYQGRFNDADMADVTRMQIPPMAEVMRLNYGPEAKAKDAARTQFWNTYNNVIPPGNASYEVKQSPLVALILERDSRRTATIEQYEMATAVMRQFVVQNFGGVQPDWTQARAEKADLDKIMAAQYGADAPRLVQSYDFAGNAERQAALRAQYPILNTILLMRYQYEQAYPVYALYYSRKVAKSEQAGVGIAAPAGAAPSAQRKNNLGVLRVKQVGR